MPVLQGMQYDQTRAGFGPVDVLNFPQFTVAVAAVPQPAASNNAVALPCNVKILAVSVCATNTAGALGGIYLNIASGATAGSGGGNNNFSTGTVTIGPGTASAAGTITLSITGPTPQTLVTPFNIGDTETVIAANIVNTILNAPNAVVSATAVAGVITLYQLLAQGLSGALGGQQLYAAVSSGGGISAAPATPTAFTVTGGSFQVGQPDNFLTSTPSSVFAGLGQMLFGRYRNVPISTTATFANTVLYPQLWTANPAPGAPPNAFSLPEYDIIFPVTRAIQVFSASPAGLASTTTVRVSALVMPVILDPNQPYPSSRMWVPNQQNIGAPSTA